MPNNPNPRYAGEFRGQSKQNPRQNYPNNSYNHGEARQHSKGGDSQSRNSDYRNGSQNNQNEEIDNIIKKIKFDAPIPLDLLSETADEAAKKLVLNINPKSNFNKPTQIRQFYDAIVLWEIRWMQHQNTQMKTSTLQSSESAINQKLKDEFNHKFLPYIKMLRANIAYSVGRKLINGDMKKFLDTIINKINTPDDLKTAKLFFEAFIGFAKYYSELNNSKK